VTIDVANIGMRILPAELPPAAAPPAAADDQPSFADRLRDAVSETDNLGLDARSQVASLIAGSGADVPDTMIAVEKADLSFQLMLQVRNKVVQAYQQIAGMQF
jgi:flagellar hook-basal body complex protein FliE